MSDKYCFPSAEMTLWCGKPFDRLNQRVAPLKTMTLTRRCGWFAEEVASSHADAQRLLKNSGESGQIAGYCAKFVSGLKALAAGVISGKEMGCRLLQDDRA